MQTDRIAELRALRKAEDDAYAAWHTTENTRAAWLAHQAAQGRTIEATGESIDALLDCAEALKPFAAIPLEHIDTPETFGMDVLRARAALARLNGDDHD